jgi:hypothetical protein
MIAIEFYRKGSDTPMMVLESGAVPPDGAKVIIADHMYRVGLVLWVVDRAPETMRAKVSLEG